MLDRVRPTVVRRRVYEPPPPAPAPLHELQAPHEVEDDDEGPPSSVNVARALASLRGHELRRLEEILGPHAEGDDDDDGDAQPAHAAQPAQAPAAPPIPSVRVGPSIAVAELARRLDVPVQDLVTALVTRGFFSITVKSTLPRETARSAAALFGWRVEDSDEVEVAPSRAVKSAARPKKAKPAKKAKASAKAPAKTAKKTTKKTSAATERARRTSRRA
jgi:hypothetical protein